MSAMMSAPNALMPLESNPEVMNKFLQKLGVSGHKLVDVMGLEPEPLSWVPRPVLAVLLLFPVSEAYEKRMKQEAAEILSRGQTISPDIFYTKQSLTNACGTVALVHSVANNVDRLALGDGALKKFLDEAKDLDPVARGALLQTSADIIAAHTELAREGQTNHTGADELVDLHFNAFIHKDGELYELDGRKAFPINHGPTTPETLLEDAAKVCRAFMERDPSDLRFTVVALTEDKV